MIQGDTESWLIIQSEGHPDRSFPLEQEAISFGRDPGNDLVLDDLEVSRLHGRFLRQAEGYLLEDLASLNGTYVNGRRLAPNQPRPLNDGDMIGLSDTLTLIYRTQALAPEMPAYELDAAPIPPGLQPTGWLAAETALEPPPPEETAYVAPEPEPVLLDAPKAGSNRLIWTLALVGCLLIILCLAALVALALVLKQQGIL